MLRYFNFESLNVLKSKEIQKYTVKKCDIL